MWWQPANSRSDCTPSSQLGAIHRLDPVLDALHSIEGLPGATVSETRALSPERGQYAQIVKIKLEIMVPDPLVDTVVQAIQRSAHTGNPGDGRIFVIAIEDTINIRTGERGVPDQAVPSPASPGSASG